MYTDVKNVQILISLLKQHGIRHFVNSPGTRNTPLVHSIENDPYFICYSIVDERSAAYFALGISEALDVPVCVTCTAATATCNYMPAIKEAAERNIQLVALTSDRDLYTMFHMQDQSINQMNMYRGYTKYCVDIPAVTNQEDEWYVNRCINEALLELNHNEKGPIQINYRVPSWGSFYIRELPKQRKIDRLTKEIDWKNVKEILNTKKRILVYVGSNYSIETSSLEANIKRFFEKYNSVVFVDNYSNINFEEIINTATLSESITEREVNKLSPDLIITLGDIFYSPIKFKFKEVSHKFEHWHISPEGNVNDGFRALTKVFECKPEEFFNNINENEKINNDKVYYKMWKERFEKVKYPDLTFTNFSVIRDVVKSIPQDSIVHMSVLNSIRLSSYFKFNDNIKCFANLGADGIDGALSTFLGQARQTSKLSFLIIGDLSYLYDLNASINIKDKNIRVLVVNNYAGAEFHKNFGLKMIPTLNLHIAAGHNTKISQCKKLNNAKYLSATNQKELEKALKEFANENSEKPIILETFTNADNDAKTLKEFWNINKEYTLKDRVKDIAKKALGSKAKAKLKKILKRG